MSESKLHIARNGLTLGALPAADARELLAAGFLQPTDEFWTDAHPARRPVSQIASFASKKLPSWIVRTRGSLVNAGSTVREQASGAARKASALARRNRAAVATATDRMLEDYLPRLREQVTHNLSQSLHGAKAALKDEVFLRQVFGAVYDCLPRSVRRFVREGLFVEFCLKHRRRLLD
jgi:hypothetical protein